jgi:hypothetical protein
MAEKLALVAPGVVRGRRQLARQKVRSHGLDHFRRQRPQQGVDCHYIPLAVSAEPQCPFPNRRNGHLLQAQRLGAQLHMGG